jgi:hypothetical protein
MKPGKVCRLVIACAVLHNIAIKRNEPLVENDQDDYHDDQPQIPPFNGQQLFKMLIFLAFNIIILRQADKSKKKYIKSIYNQSILLAVHKKITHTDKEKNYVYSLSIIRC